MVHLRLEKARARARSLMIQEVASSSRERREEAEEAEVTGSHKKELVNTNQRSQGVAQTGPQAAEGDIELMMPILQRKSNITKRSITQKRNSNTGPPKSKVPNIKERIKLRVVQPPTWATKMTTTLR